MSVAGLRRPPPPPVADVGRRRRLPLLVLPVVALAAALTWVAEPVRIPTESMSPTLRPGDHVLLDKLGTRTGPWRRDDVVAFSSPENGELTIKRIVGLAGDSVSIEDGQLHINGRAVREPFADPRQIDGVYFGPARVPRGTVFVLGDNRGNSKDSRVLGPVPVGSLRGRVTAVIWPPTRW